MCIHFIVVLQARLILTQSIEAAIAVFVDMLWLSEGFLFYKDERTERLLVCVPSGSLAATHRGSTAAPPGPHRDRGLFVDANDVISLRVSDVSIRWLSKHASVMQPSRSSRHSVT